MCWLNAGYDPTTSGGKIYEALLYSSANTASQCPVPSGSVTLPERSWFDQAGILIARPDANEACRITVALKGGHNDEHHNHNDVGSYVVAIDGKLMLTDPGSEVYTARTFSAQRYESDAMNSFGHPVPLLAGAMQRTGRQAQALWKTVDFTGTQDHLVMDLTSAYDVPSLRQVTREFRFMRAGQGCFIITDQATFTSPQTFETCIVTFESVEQLQDQWIVTQGSTRLAIDIDTGGAAYEVTTTPLTADFRASKTPKRWGIRLKEPTLKATVTLKIAPVL